MNNLYERSSGDKKDVYMRIESLNNAIVQEILKSDGIDFKIIDNRKLKSVYLAWINKLLKTNQKLFDERFSIISTGECGANVLKKWCEIICEWRTNKALCDDSIRDREQKNFRGENPKCKKPDKLTYNKEIFRLGIGKFDEYRRKELQSLFISFHNSINRAENVDERKFNLYDILCKNEILTRMTIYADKAKKFLKNIDTVLNEYDAKIKEIEQILVDDLDENDKYIKVKALRVYLCSIKNLEPNLHIIRTKLTKFQENNQNLDDKLSSKIQRLLGKIENVIRCIEVKKEKLNSIDGKINSLEYSIRQSDLEELYKDGDPVRVEHYSGYSIVDGEIKPPMQKTDDEGLNAGNDEGLNEDKGMEEKITKIGKGKKNRKKREQDRFCGGLF